MPEVDVATITRLQTKEKLIEQLRLQVKINLIDLMEAQKKENSAFKDIRLYERGFQLRWMMDELTIISEVK